MGEQVPVSLKDLSNIGSVKNVFREIRDNGQQISKAENLDASNVNKLPTGTLGSTVIHVQTPQFSAKEIVDFVGSSKPNIFVDKAFSKILIDTKDGVVTIVNKQVKSVVKK